MSSITLKVRGLEELERFFRQQAVNLAGGPRTVEIRAEGQRNQVIAEAQAQRDRNPFFLTSSETRSVVGKMAEALSNAMRYQSRARWREDLADAGEVALHFYRDHIHEERSGGVPPIGASARGHKTRKLTADYADWKRKHFGDRPILVATGEFIKSLVVKVR